VVGLANEAGRKVLVTLADPTQSNPVSEESTMPDNPITSPETLSDFVRRIRREKHLSCSDAEKRSARFGRRISGSYINRIENDPTLRPTADRLRALANGLGVPVPELMARAFGLASYGERSSDELSLVTRYRELSPKRQADVLKLVDLYYSERADSRDTREPAHTQPTLNLIKRKE
jgi:transcriptional regulator with XRE-family HTH domain